MSNSIAPGSSADVNVKVTALTTNPNVPVTYKTIILKKNLVNGVNTLTQAMMNQTNTKYVIKYDYTLGEDITVPSGCILEFDGGSINGTYTVTGTNTVIQAELIKVFAVDVILNGSWNIDEVYAEWFGAIGDGIADDIIPLQKAALIAETGPKLVLCHNHKISSTLFITKAKIDGKNYAIDSQASDIAIKLVGNNWRLIIENLTLTSSNTVTDYGIYSNDETVGESLIRNVRISYFAEAGIYIDRAWYTNITDCRIERCTNYGMKLMQAYSAKLYNIDSVWNNINISLSGSSCSISHCDLSYGITKCLELISTNGVSIDNFYVEVSDNNSKVIDFASQVLGISIDGLYCSIDGATNCTIINLIDNDYEQGINIGETFVELSNNASCVFLSLANSEGKHQEITLTTVPKFYVKSSGGQYNLFRGYGCIVYNNIEEGSRKTSLISNGIESEYFSVGNIKHPIEYHTVKENHIYGAGNGTTKSFALDHNYFTFKGFVEIMTNKGNGKYYINGYTDTIILLETTDNTLFNSEGIRLVGQSSVSYPWLFCIIPNTMTSDDNILIKTYKNSENIY